MAWEWVAPVATGAVGVAGILGTWFTGKQSRDQALETLREQLGHDRLQAREAREQERLESAYLELLKMAERVGVWAQMIYPVMQSGEPPETPLPSLEVQADAAALMASFGTDEVREKLEAWQSVVKQMITAAEQVVWEEADPSGRRLSEISPRVTIHQLRPEEKRTRDALGAQVRAELRFRYRSSAKASGLTGSYSYAPDELTEQEGSAALERAPHPPDDRQPEPTPGTPERSTPPPSQ